MARICAPQARAQLPLATKFLERDSTTYTV